MTGPFGSGSFGTSEYGNSPLYTTKSLIDAVLRDTGHANPSTETNRRIAVLGFLNNRYATVTTKRSWDWLFQTIDFQFDAPYETGTIDVTSRSETVNGNSTFWNSNVVPNNVLTINGKDDRFIIEDISSNVILTLEGEYVGDTESALGYKIIKPIYTAPSNCEHLQSVILHGSNIELLPKGTQEFRRIQANNPTLTGIPRFFTEVGRRSQDGIRTFEVYPAPDMDYSVQLNYGVNIQKLQDEDGNYPLIPDRHRVVLYYGAMAEMYMFQRDPESAAMFEKKFERALLDMQGDSQLTDSKLQYAAKRGRTGVRKRSRYDVAWSRSDFGKED